MMTGKSKEIAETASIRALLQRGRDRGFVSFRDVDRTLTGEHLTLERLESLIQALFTERIEIRCYGPAVVEKTRGTRVDSDNRSFDEAHLIALSKTPLLTREGEVELTRQIAMAREAIRRRIIASGIALPEFELLIERLRNKEIRLQQVTRRTASSGFVAFRRQFELELYGTVFLERHYRYALACGETLGPEFLARRRERIERLELADLFWLEVAERIRRISSRMVREPASKRSLCAQTGIEPSALKALAIEITRAEVRAEQAKNDIVQSNLRLVLRYAYNHVTAQLPLSDLIQEGTIGLMRAVEKFDYRRGFRFSTYASWWIRQGVNRAIANKSRIIRVPVHLNASMQKIARATHRLQHEFGRQPTDQEIAQAVNLTTAKLYSIREASLTMHSLDTPAGERDGPRLSDSVADKSARMSDEEAGRKEQLVHAEQLLATLTTREQKVLRMRYGLGQRRGATLEEIGNDIGVSRERVRQIETKALEKLRIWGRGKLS